MIMGTKADWAWVWRLKRSYMSVRVCDCSAVKGLNPSPFLGGGQHLLEELSRFLSAIVGRVGNEQIHGLGS